MMTNASAGSAVSIKSVLLAAIGGQGGNVLIEWLFLAAERDGRRAQALSLPGLSQRGGGTNFYLEIAGLTDPTDDPARLEGVTFAQFPFPGRVDVLVGQELVELGRLVQGGYASRQTTVVTSSQRIFTIGEKMPAFDGVFSSDKIVEATTALAGSLAVVDTERLAQENGLGDLATNAILLGVLAAVSDALPMGVDRYREAISQFGLAVEMNLKAFEVGYSYGLNFSRDIEAFEAASVEDQGLDQTATFRLTNTIPLPGPAKATDGAADSGTTPAPKKAKRQISLTPITKSSVEKKPLDLARLIETHAEGLPTSQRKEYLRLTQEIVALWPLPLQATLIEAVYQLADYQDLKYARRYLELVKSVFEVEGSGETEWKLTQTYAKTLAMRMTYEDAVRVAFLKLKPGRLDRIRRDMGVKPGQILQVTDYLKPDAAEIYGIMPNVLVGPMLLLGRITGIGGWLGRQHFTFQQHPKVTSFSGHMTFRFLTLFKPFRLSSHRFRQEWRLIRQYTALVIANARLDYELALLIAESGRLVKGYGDTRRKMIDTIEQYYSKVIKPMVEWEKKAQAKDKTSQVAPFAVTVAAGRAALQLIGRSDEGISQARALVERNLKEAKDGRARAEILAQSSKTSF